MTSKRLHELLDNIDARNVVKKRQTAKQLNAILLDTAPVADAIHTRNLYGRAFGIARRQQLGLDGPTLAKNLDELTAAEVEKCLEEYFAKEKRATAIVK